MSVRRLRVVPPIIILPIVAPTLLAMDETRRQVQSLTIDAVFDFRGAGVSIGQNERTGVPIAHTDVPFTPRAAGEPTALHALQVAGIMVSRHATYSGMAPAASLFSDEPTNNGQAAGTIPGAGSATENNFLESFSWLTSAPRNARVINYSDFLPNGAGNPANPSTKASLGLDYLITQPRAAGGDFLFVKSAGNNGTMPVTEPGAAFNILTVGAVTSEDYRANTLSHQGPANRRWGIVANFSSHGGAGGISKPDLVAPGARIDTDMAEVGLTMAHTGPANSFSSNAGSSFVGTSYAAPHVAGIAAQLYGALPNTDHRLMKAVLMNSADKTVRGCEHNAGAPVFFRKRDPEWTAGAHGLDVYSGTGMVDAWGAAIQLQSNTARIGTATGNAAAGSGDIAVTTAPVGIDAKIVATVVWDRQVTRTPPPGGNPPQDYTFQADANQPHFALRYNAPLSSLVRNTASGSVQHIAAVVSEPGNYDIKINNNGTAAGNYAVAWAVSPPDVNPGIGDVYFTVRDQIHQPRAENVGAEMPHVEDRIREGRSGTRVRDLAGADALGFANGVESRVYRSSMAATNSEHRSATAIGLVENGAAIDDHVNDISFGRDHIAGLIFQGGQVHFSVDAFAQGLSPVGVGNPNNGVFAEATIVHEAAGDVFKSAPLVPGAGPITNSNVRIQNQPDTDLLQPLAGSNTNTTHADSYYMGLVGGRVSDREDDVTGLEGVAGSILEPALNGLEGDFLFLTVDRGSPSATGGGPLKTGNVYVSKGGTDGAQIYATAAQLGLNETDCIDGLLVQELSGVGPNGFPVFDPDLDGILFSVDRDSLGLAATAVTLEAFEGEVAGDVFFARPGNTNILALEATDLGLQEFFLGGNQNWLSDNLDALDLVDANPATLSRWTRDNGGGVWSDANNWNGGVPNSQIAVARFLGDITAQRTLTNDAAHTVQGLIFDNPHGYIIDGAQPIIIKTTASTIRGFIDNISGSHIVSAPINFMSDTTIRVAANGLTLSGDLNAGGVGLRKIGAGEVGMKHIRADSMAIVEGKVTILPRPNNSDPAGTSKLRELALAGGATPTVTLDISNTAFVIDYSGDSPLQLIRSQIISGYAAGTWNGPGITSTNAAVFGFAIGYGEASNIFGAFPANFVGQQADNSSLLFRMTRFGDADLNGVVSLFDFNRLAANFGIGGALWTQGDFTYDGFVNLFDFNRLAANFGLLVGSDGPTPADWAALAAAVPEPGSALSMMMLAMGSLLRFRRRRHRSVQAK